MNVGDASELVSATEAVPRFDSGLEKPEIQTVLAPWTLENSMFKEAILSKEQYDQCLGSDFNHSSIDRIIKSQITLKKVQNDLRSAYPELVETYKYFATKSGKETSIYLNY
jgi:hypothetical protein